MIFPEKKIRNTTYFILPVCLLLSACGSGQEETQSAENSENAEQSKSSSLPFKPGKWQKSIEFISANNDNENLDAAKDKKAQEHFAKMEGARQSQEVCIGEGEIKAPSANLFLINNEGCQTDSFNIRGDMVDITRSCKNPQEEGSMLINGQVNKDNYNLDAVVNITNKDIGDFEMQVKLTGMYLGECDGAPAAEQGKNAGAEAEQNTGAQ